MPVSVAGSDQANPDGQAYYLVFELDEKNHPKLVYQQRVTMSATPASDAIERVQMENSSAPANGNSIRARVFSDSGELVFYKHIQLDQDIRAEFAGSDGLRIEGHHLHSSASAFVLRLPAFTNGVLKLESQSVSEFSLEKIAADTSRTRPTSEQSQSVQMLNGEPSNRVDILIVGDGYSASESGLFDADVLNFNNNFFAISPYREYRSFVNSTSLFTPSEDSGADHPQYDPDCPKLDLRCCADPNAMSDPLSGTIVETAFDATFCRSNIFRLIGVNETKVYIAAAAHPDWDKIFVLINDPEFGGAGGNISIASSHPNGTAIIQHEYGHSFSNLADEYETPFPTFPACSDLPEDTGVQSCEANVTNQIDRALVKWQSWIDDATPIPTPEGMSYFDDIGLFEGARYLDANMYRPKESCAMRDLGAEFCEICQQQYILSLYQGGWGVPNSGIDLIEPGSEIPAPGALSVNGPITLSVEVLQPVGGVTIEWKVDGVPQVGEGSSRFIFYPDADGTYLVEVEVSDPTEKVHPEVKPDGELSSHRQWTITADVDALTPINAGMNDAWVSTEAPLQGLFFTVFPDHDLFFLSWFTFDSEILSGGQAAGFGAFDQRWVTGSGSYSGNRVTIDAELTSGGVFNSADPLAAQQSEYGTITVVFINCNESELIYDFPSAGLSGQQSLTRVLPENAALCTELVNAEAHKEKLPGMDSERPVKTAAVVDPTVNVGMNDAWVSADAPYQGLFFTIFPDSEIFFLSWFTFDSEIPLGEDTAVFGAFDQRWITGSGPYSGNSATISVELTSGGVFGAADPMASQEADYGTITVEFNSCNEAELSYDFTSAGLSGQTTLTRVLPDNAALCMALAAP